MDGYLKRLEDPRIILLHVVEEQDTSDLTWCYCFPQPLFKAEYHM